MGGCSTEQNDIKNKTYKYAVSPGVMVWPHEPSPKCPKQNSKVGILSYTSGSSNGSVVEVQQ